MPLWQKYLAALGLLLAMALGGAVFMALWPEALLDSALVPRTAFVVPPPLAPGAYDSEALWLARPGMAAARNAAALVPPGWRDPPAPPLRAAVFFVPGTTSFASNHWNDRLDKRDAPARDRLFLGLMASPFNRGEVWAPLYRQVVGGAFLGQPAAARAAVDAAYADVRAAFDAFLAAQPPDRGIVIAGHDQGALMVLRLLRDRIVGRPLATRLVAAYAIGWPVSRAGVEARLGVPPCAGPSQPGCLASWNSFAEPADPAGLLTSLAPLKLEALAPPFVCTNPLTGGAATEAPATANLGTLLPDPAKGEDAVQPARVAARCDAQGWLLIGKPIQLGSFVQPGNNYGTYDIPLFWANLRADVARREAGWYGRRHD